MFMVSQGAVYRYCLDGPDTEFGKIDNVKVSIEVASGTIGDTAAFKKTTWFRTGFSFFSPLGGGGAKVKSILTLAESALVGPIPGVNQYHLVQTDKEYAGDGGHYDLVVPAGIGRQTVASTIIQLEGNLVLGAVSFWGTGGVMSREET
jgi:hypothetical protein